jgi:hypothetical protein
VRRRWGSCSSGNERGGVAGCACACDGMGLGAWLDGNTARDECGRGWMSGVEGQGMARLGEDVEGRFCSVGGSRLK